MSVKGLIVSAINNVLSYAGAEIGPVMNLSRKIVDVDRKLIRDDEYIVEFKRTQLDGALYFLPMYALHRPAVKSLLGGQLYERKTHALIAELLRLRPGNLVHAGTFYGDMIPSFSKACSGTVFAFEPVLENYVLAKLCVQENCIDNVILLNAALSSKISVARIDTEGEDGLHSGGASKIAPRGQVTAFLTIDCLEITDLSVIQLDIEGHEQAALSGARRTIENSSPTILVEDNSKNCDALLKEVGYVRVGDIPGLSVWASSKYRYDTKRLIKDA